MRDEPDFYIGYLPTPPRLRSWLIRLVSQAKNLSVKSAGRSKAGDLQAHVDNAIRSQRGRRKLLVASSGPSSFPFRCRSISQFHGDCATWQSINDMRSPRHRSVRIAIRRQRVLDGLLQRHCPALGPGRCKGFLGQSGTNRRDGTIIVGAVGEW